MKLRLFVLFIIVYHSLSAQHKRIVSQHVEFKIDTIVVDKNAILDTGRYQVHYMPIVVYYSLLLKTDANIKIPVELIFHDFANWKEYGDILMKLEKFDSTSKKYKKWPLSLELVPRNQNEIHYKKLNQNEKLYDSLYLGQAKEVGQYRMRLWFMLSNHNKGIKDVFSNWFYFAINKKPFYIDTIIDSTK